MEHWNQFAAEDPFNGNFVEGEVCRESNDMYGALKILRVNGEEAPQLIYGTPKVGYPFDRAGNWHFPPAKVIERYTKLDGTNVFAYRYNDAQERVYLTYKTRLLPFLRQSRFGPFLDLWREILQAQPSVAELPGQTDLNLSYEMWGARNPHLVRYSTPLTASLLFARKGREILPPSQIPGGQELAAPMKGVVAAEYISAYHAARAAMNQDLRETEDGYLGEEGEIWYLLDETGQWTMLKCKPELIEAVHWAAGGIDKNTIIATCWNALENWDNPTVDQVKSLLLEEYALNEVEKAQNAILRHLEEVRRQQEFRAQVIEAYREMGMNILLDKAAVMRALSQRFDRSLMSRVYTVIMDSEAK